jgi:hypothetical protein
MKTTAIGFALAFIALRCLAADVPQELAAARARHQAAVATATKPLYDRYVQELQQMKSRAMLNKNLELAVAVDAELKTLGQPGLPAAVAGGTPKPVVPAPPSGTGQGHHSLKSFATIEEFQQWLLTTEWVTKDGNTTYSFPAPGKIQRVEKKSPDRPLSFKIETPKIGAITWHWASGGDAAMTIDPTLHEGKDSGGKTMHRNQPK